MISEFVGADVKATIINRKEEALSNLFLEREKGKNMQKEIMSLFTKVQYLREGRKGQTSNGTKLGAIIPIICLMA